MVALSVDTFTVYYFDACALCPFSKSLFCLSYSNECKSFEVDFSKIFLRAFKNFLDIDTETIRMKFLVFIYHCKSKDLNLKNVWTKPMDL